MRALLVGLWLLCGQLAAQQLEIRFLNVGQGDASRPFRARIRNESRRAVLPGFRSRSETGYAEIPQVCETSATSSAESMGNGGAGGGIRTHKGFRPEI